VLVDETFGLTLRAAARNDVDDIVAYKSAADMVLLSGWVIGTGIGAWFGGTIDPGQVGIGVLFGLLFLGLAIPMVTARRDWGVLLRSLWRRSAQSWCCPWLGRSLRRLWSRLW
jgi:predicted branched-subunit amino acid permease